MAEITESKNFIHAFIEEDIAEGGEVHAVDFDVAVALKEVGIAALDGQALGVISHILLHGLQLVLAQ